MAIANQFTVLYHSCKEKYREFMNKKQTIHDSSLVYIPFPRQAPDGLFQGMLAILRKMLYTVSNFQPLFT